MIVQAAAKTPVRQDAQMIVQAAAKTPVWVLVRGHVWDLVKIPVMQPAGVVVKDTLQRYSIHHRQYINEDVCPD
jgi:hypothetical protein